MNAKFKSIMDVFYWSQELIDDFDSEWEKNRDFLSRIIRDEIEKELRPKRIVLFEEEGSRVF